MESTVTENAAPALDWLLEKVYQHGGYDFRQYKRGMVTRRLQRRLYAVGVSTFREYLPFLDTHPEEYQRIADDLTIKVSGFFRSPYAFQQIAWLVLPSLVSDNVTRKERGLRFWSAACARGEEPYSIAMLLAQSLGETDLNVSIYATDISHPALQEATAGIYSPRDVAGLAPAVLEKYFIGRSGCYEVRADIKQMVSFSYFDLATTTLPPFTNLDGIFCCNVLIYLQAPLQERVLSMLYDALATPGYVVLGEAETPTTRLRERLVCLDTKAKIYKKAKDNDINDGKKEIFLSNTTSAATLSKS